MVQMLKLCINSNLFLVVNDISELSNFNMSGIIPSSINNFTRLSFLDMSYNTIIGTIPETLYSFSLLQTL